MGIMVYSLFWVMQDLYLTRSGGRDGADVDDDGRHDGSAGATNGALMVLMGVL